MDNKPNVIYPCWWTYAIVGHDEEDLRVVAAEVAGSTPYRSAFSKQSEHKRFASLHVDIQVASEAQRNHFFDAFKTHPRVRFVI